LESAHKGLAADSAGFVDWSRTGIAPVLRAAVGFAGLSQSVAERLGGVDPVCAWCGGLLAPLGWMAVCAVDPDAAADGLQEVQSGDGVSEFQRRLWRLDAQAIARRLARRWKLPTWLRAIVGGLSVPAEMADALDANDRLFRIVQLAVVLGQANGHPLGLPVGTDLIELTESLGFSDEAISELLQHWRDAEPDRELGEVFTDPRSLRLLPDLLALAIEKRAADEGPFAEQLEREVDRLQQEMIVQRAGEAERLQRQKLRALAELAAGAGHEINNPLAVISGQSQYLLSHEEDPARQASLRAIVRQAERIHQILNDLMHFARPPQPRRQTVDLCLLVQAVLEELRPPPEQKPLTCEFIEPSQRAVALADPAMARTALSCLVRNAVEAAPAEGWVRVGIEDDDRGWMVAVEDSGPGPQPAQREHLFDPFWSGRHAGRGRGLGLPTAWRLAQQNDGDVRFEPLPDHPSRFVLSLPHAKTNGTVYPLSDDVAERKSA
jgi:signal transduction histidine kinase